MPSPWNWTDRQTDRQAWGQERYKEPSISQSVPSCPLTPDLRPPSPGQKPDVPMAPVQPQIWGRDTGSGSGGVPFDLLPLTQTQDDWSWRRRRVGEKGQGGFGSEDGWGAGT